MNEDRTAHGEIRELRQRIETLETAPRIPNLTAGGVGGSSTATPLVVVPATGAHVAVASGETVTFEATGQGTAVVMAFVNHTLEVSAGLPAVYLTVGIDDTVPDDAYAVRISSSVSPWTQTDAIVAYFTGLTPGTHTAQFFSRKDATGTVLSYTLNSQAIVVIPL